MDLSTQTKLAIVERSLQAIRQAIFDQTIAARVAKRVDDMDQYDALKKELVKLDKRLEEYLLIKAEVEAEKDEDA